MSDYEQGNLIEHQAQIEYQRQSDLYREGKISNAQLLLAMRVSEQARKEANDLRGFNESV